MLDRNPNTPGVRLDLRDYDADYAARFAAAPGHDSWKLERQQSFRERRNPSWEAFVQGDWQESIRLTESQRAEITAELTEAAGLNVELFRVRVVEKPFAPYLHWELYLLKERAECGEKIRVVTGDQVADFEPQEPLPEILTVGQDTVYQIIYNDDGILEGAIRFVDLDTASRWKNFIEELYQRGEELDRFFQREVAALQPPIPESPGVS